VELLCPLQEGHCQRGIPIDSKSESEVIQLLSVAKELRNVTDELTKKNLYINDHLSREENSILYARRQAKKNTGHAYRPTLIAPQTSVIYADAPASALICPKSPLGGGNNFGQFSDTNTCFLASI